MSESENTKQESPDQLSDILLVLNKETMKIEAVKGIGKNGELETVPPTKRNENQFMKVDKHGDIFSNFFSNFLSQLKNPTKFSFFKVSAPEAAAAAAEIKDALKKPSPDSDTVLSKYEVPTDGQGQNQPQNQNNMENEQAPVTTQETNGPRYKMEDIDWETMANLGLGKDKLEKLKILEPLLKGYKTNELVPISLNLGTAITRFDARLSLQQNQEGKVVVAIHGIRKEPNLASAFFGHVFTKEDKDNLRKTGNMGRLVELENPKTKEKALSFISIDKLTKEIIAAKAEKVKIPEEIKGVKLTEDQKQTLSEGKPVFLEGMVSKKGEVFSSEVQYNADKRYVEFLFDSGNSPQQAQNNQEVQVYEAPRNFRGKELGDEQYEKFKIGETIYVDELAKKGGGTYQGYITFDKKTGETDFSFDNPDKLKAKVQPRTATQVAPKKRTRTNKAKDRNEPVESEQKVTSDIQQAEGRRTRGRRL